MQCRSVVALVGLVLLLLLCGGAWCAEELYIITTSAGAQIVVQDYDFSGDTVTYTTRDGARGSIRKNDFLSIANMIGVSPGQAEEERSVRQQKEREILIWIGAAALIVILYLGYLFWVARERRGGDREGADIHFLRIEKTPVTQGYLAFAYRGILGRRRDWTIDVHRAYEEEGILFVEGVCTATGRRKTFRGDRVAGEVLDRSSERRAPLADFFIDAQERRV